MSRWQLFILPISDIKNMQTIYLAHPIGGNIEENLEAIRGIIRTIAQYRQDVVPFVPYYAYVVSLNDAIPEQRAQAMAWNEHILRSGMVKQLWLTGNNISAGMKEEIRIAEEMGIPVINKQETY